MQGNRVISAQPEVQTLDTILDSIQTGELRIPKFQRPFVWGPELMISLFDSIEQGYPIGSLLVWQTQERLTSLDEVSGIEVGPAEGSQLVSYVLDGHQRLATLFGCLHRPAAAPHSTDQNDWMWWVYRELGRGGESPRYRHWRAATQSVPPHYLPLRSILRTMDFLRFTRKLDEDLPTRSAELIEEADYVAQRFKGYKVPVVRIIGGDIGQATEVFTRINTSGRSLTPGEVASAHEVSGVGQTPEGQDEDAQEAPPR